MEKIDDDNNVEESIGKKHISLKLDCESVKFDLQIEDCRTDKFDEEIENSKPNIQKESPEHWEKKLEVKLKSLELIETEIDNRVQNMHKMAAALIIGVSSLGIYLFGKTDISNIILLCIPLLVCFISAYLTNHQKTMIYDSANAKQLETDINELFDDKDQPVIYFEHLTSPLYAFNDDFQKIIDWFLVIFYFSPIIAYIIMFSNQEFANLFERDFSNYNLLSLLLMIVWIISITYLTYFYYFNAKLIKEYKVEVECYIKQYKEKKDDSNCIWTDFPKFDIFRLRGMIGVVRYQEEIVS